MKRSRVVLLAAWLVLVSAALTLTAAPANPAKTRVLIVTGGHEFEHAPFFAVFDANTNIAWKTVAHPNAHALLEKEAARAWDVLLVYDLHEEITAEAKANFLARLKDGKGLVVLHHAIASYQAWPEYEKIIGAKYYLQKTSVGGVEKPQSTYLHGVAFHVRPLQPDHPILKGISDYDLVDETYDLFDVSPSVTPLLASSAPIRNQIIGWCKTYEASRVVYLQSGHDHTAFENPNFRRILAQAIAWVAEPH